MKMSKLYTIYTITFDVRPTMGGLLFIDKQSITEKQIETLDSETKLYSVGNDITLDFGDLPDHGVRMVGRTLNEDLLGRLSLKIIDTMVSLTETGVNKSNNVVALRPDLTKSINATHPILVKGILLDKILTSLFPEDTIIRVDRKKVSNARLSDMIKVNDLHLKELNTIGGEDSKE